MKTVVKMGADGRLTVPAAARRELGIDGEVEFELEVVRDRISLLPNNAVDHYDDSWADTPEHRERMERARRDVEDGRVYRLTVTELKQLAGLE